MKKSKSAPLTPQEIRTSVILSAFNRAKLAHNLGKIKTWEEYQKELGILSGAELELYFPISQLNSPITYAQIQEDQREQINRISEIEKEKIREVAYVKPQPEEHEYPEGNRWSPFNSSINNGKTITSNPISIERVEAFNSLQSRQIALYSKDKKDRIFTSPKQKAKLFGFQNKAAGNIVDNIEKRNLRAQLLLAGVGIGKTYIVGAAIRYLFDKGFFSDSISPWPCVWITRASIVEQTKRVCERDFGLDTVSEVEVFNVEQLRSSFGEQMLKEEIIIEQGEEHQVWKWRKNLPPKLIILDECQLAKNEQSTQSKIIQSIANIEEYIHLLCMSATPFTRVAESKYFCVNTHMEI